MQVSHNTCRSHLVFEFGMESVNQTGGNERTPGRPRDGTNRKMGEKTENCKKKCNFYYYPPAKLLVTRAYNFVIMIANHPNHPPKFARDTLKKKGTHEKGAHYGTALRDGQTFV